MILVTGGTGFIGKALIKQLVALGKPVRTLLRPSKESPHLPLGVGVDVAVSSLNDERGLRSALKDVDTIFHFASSERQGTKADLQGVEIEGTQTLTRVAAEVGVDRIFYLSHIGVDRFSAYPVFKAKAIAENYIINSGLDYTIFRSSAVFGPGDVLTHTIKQLLKLSKPFLFIPEEGKTRIQPLWIDDLVACLILALDRDDTRCQVYTIGGGEYLTIREIIQIMMEVNHIRRGLVSLSPAYLRILYLFLDQMFPRWSLSTYWLDYLAADRTCDLDTLPRVFGLMPERFSQMTHFFKI
jgi:NADH dehydrogenase